MANPLPSRSSTAQPAASERSDPRPRVYRAIALGIGALLLLILTAIFSLTFLDWNRARPWVNERVSEAAGRKFEIIGDIDVHWVWPQPLDSGWRHWIPGLLVRADHIELANRADFGYFGALSESDQRTKPPSLSPDEPAKEASKSDAAPAKTPATNDALSIAPLMARVGSASGTIRLLPLLGRVVLIDRLTMSNPDVALGRAANGDNNWTFPKADESGKESKPNRWSVEVGQMQLSGGQIAYADTAQKLAVRAQVDTEDENAPGIGADREALVASESKTSESYGLSFEVTGTYRDAEVKGSGRAGQLLSLRNDTVQYPIAFDLQTGTTRATASGTLTNPRKLTGVDMMVSVAGASMADLYDLTGLVLPNTPPYKTQGHLVGSLEPERATWDYENFSGVVGKSDLEGHLTYTSSKPRPRLKGQIKSRKLQLADLGPLVGTPAGAGAGKRKTSRPDKVLPDNQFATGRWDAMDLDVAFLGQKLLGPSALPLDDMSARVILKEGVLRLEPLRFGIAKGRINAIVQLDGHAEPLNAQIQATVDDLQLSSLFPKVELLDKSFGRLDGAFALSGNGNSVASMLATSSGESRVYIRDGTFSKQMLDLAALNVGSVIVSKLFGEDKEVKLRCAVADFSVKNGVAQTRSVKLSTNEAVVEAVGTIDFKHEYIDLRVKPESLEWKFLSLRTPLNVRGPFIKPEISPEVGPLLARAGAAVLGAVVAPAALALVPITVPAAEDDEQCAKLLARADEAVKAGPAGAKAKPEPIPRSAGKDTRKK